MTVFLDTAVFMFAAGTPHPLRASCQAVVKASVSGELQATTSAEVVQEVLHRFSGTVRASDGATLARSVLVAFNPVLPVDHAVMNQMIALTERYPQATARDLVHVATCIEHEIEQIISPDRDFDHYVEVQRLHPDSQKMR